VKLEWRATLSDERIVVREVRVEVRVDFREEVREEAVGDREGITGGVGKSS
jgi:hypothetical protein